MQAELNLMRQSVTPLQAFLDLAVETQSSSRASSASKKEGENINRKNLLSALSNFVLSQPIPVQMQAQISKHFVLASDFETFKSKVAN